MAELKLEPEPKEAFRSSHAFGTAARSRRYGPGCVGCVRCLHCSFVDRHAHYTHLLSLLVRKWACTGRTLQMRSYSSMSRMKRSEPFTFLNSATLVNPSAWNTCALNPYFSCVATTMHYHVQHLPQKGHGKAHTTAPWNRMVLRSFRTDRTGYMSELQQYVIPSRSPCRTSCQHRLPTFHNANERSVHPLSTAAAYPLRSGKQMQS